ncbi:hypothetical protein [Nodosilinea sp. P-1105]|uniref:hypothetical protein n=1 Tax=Nodosilinea sp. P-1105 TaxID=2546229 RepID=UPI00146B3D89|nr:hypothetical protein [Nodosilinea sp. P-1105]NMF86226.1 hypothetical protein [Nodosilinea sp. P-1105]
MRLVRYTPSRLTLRPIPWDAWIMGILLIGIGSLGMLALGRAILECDRVGSNQCTLSSSSWFTSEAHSFPISSMHEATLETYEDSEGEVSYRVSITTDQSSIPLTNVFLKDLRKQDRDAYAINQFINTPEANHLYIKQDKRWVGILFFIFFGGFGLLLLCLNKVEVFDFDKKKIHYA